VQAIVEDLGVEPDAIAEVALRYILSHPAVSTVIPGMRTIRNVERNCAVGDGKGPPRRSGRAAARAPVGAQLLQVAVLRRAGPADAAFIAALRVHPEVAPFVGVREADEAELRRELAHADPAVAGRFVIDEGAGPVGALAWRLSSRRSRIVDLSEIVVLPEARGRGLGTAATREVCRELAARLDAHRFQLETYAFNEAGIRAFERAGFVREGVRRQAYWRRDAWQDGVVFGLLADELDGSGA
jgi:RimJ/RimL family protein N-acetyltransferase